MLKHLIRFAACTLALALCFAAASADVPHTISYQGLLLGSGGAAVPDGNYSITFKLYIASSGGAALWTETQGSVAVSKGLFSVILGSSTPIAITFDSQLWLGIAVAPDPEMTPRVQLTSSAYSLGIADGSVTSNKLASLTAVRSLNGLSDAVSLIAGTNVSITSLGNAITVNSTGSGLTLPYSGTLSSGATGFTVTNNGTGSAGIFQAAGSTNATLALGGYNYSTATNSYGVYGRMVSTGVGSVCAAVRGVNSSTNDNGVGVWGSHAGGGWGLYGTSVSGLGVYGVSNTSDGIYGQTSGSNVAGVYGTAGSGAGVWGNSTSGTGVYAFSTAGYAIQVIGHFIQGGGIFEASPTSTVWSTNKPATVKLNDGQAVKLFSEEATEVLFSDRGRSSLQNGRVHVELDPKFRQTITVDAAHALDVVVQLEGDCNGVFVTNKTETGFDVVELQGGRSAAPFFYKVTGKRKYYEDERLASLEEDTRYNENMLQRAWPEKVRQFAASVAENKARLLNAKPAARAQQMDVDAAAASAVAAPASAH